MKAAAVALALLLTAAPVVGAELAPPDAAQEPAPDHSLDKMRSVLEHKPLRLDVLDIQPTFKIEIKAIHPMHEIFDKPLWQLDPIGWQPDAIGFNLLTAFSYVSRAAANAKRARDTRQAKEEVQQAIDDYCAVQPNARSLQICASSPILR